MASELLHGLLIGLGVGVYSAALFWLGHIMSRVDD